MKNQIINQLSMGEGNTPLVRLRKLEQRLSWPGKIWAKAEYQNPTGSFKDRGSIAEITEALSQKKSGVVCASTGNMAASLAAYAARAGLTCTVVIPLGTPQAKLAQARECGATLVEISGSYDVCVVEAKKLSTQQNYLLCGDFAIRRDGQASIGEELAQSPTGFDAFIVPVGNGTVGCAVASGFAKYNQFPAFIGAQGQDADPITRAWGSNNSISSIKKPQTAASAMCVGNPLDGNLTLDWIKKTNGSMFSVTDEEILEAQRMLSQLEGIFVEKSAAVSVAVLLKLKQLYANIVLILTGSGLKELC